MRRAANGNQPGDPARIADVIIDVTEAADPPVRLLLGSDAVAAALTAAETLAASDAKWRTVSESVAYAN
ncbi:hypothetical protein O7635_32395 [Asanoa sp. WMMD1127]|uniref:hypothetical protein n=1 Tax=Asanoa sp. WMMD1127 TaxID=3016107 RepID=UPI0024177C15|nr:hypothetical protein [Asanoa sp. WMMD1127]MDG4826575.1 hypothetical protein [Asanoa sp. WMMD1127]